MSGLHVDVAGSGPDLVLLHGWGMHSGLWGPWLDKLQQNFRVHAVDLPGHGFSSPIASNSLQDWTEAILEIVPDRAAWVGWSLGGLVSLSAACFVPERVTHLMLVASTPRFVLASDWPDGVDPDVLEEFSRQLEKNSGKTIVRFLTLQVRGSEHSAELLRYLREGLQQRPLPTSVSLAAGLELLRQTDLRSRLQYCNPYLLLGERDTLTPASLASNLGDARSLVIPGAGHTPFLSYPDLCASFVTRCFSDHE